MTLARELSRLVLTVAVFAAVMPILMLSKWALIGLSRLYERKR